MLWIYGLAHTVVYVSVYMYMGWIAVVYELQQCLCGVHAGVRVVIYAVYIVPMIKLFLYLLISFIFLLYPKKQII